MNSVGSAVRHSGELGHDLRLLSKPNSMGSQGLSWPPKAAVGEGAKELRHVRGSWLSQVLLALFCSYSTVSECGSLAWPTFDVTETMRSSDIAISCTIGRRTVKVEPWPSSLAAVICPPCT